LKAKSPLYKNNT